MPLAAEIERDDPGEKIVPGGCIKDLREPRNLV